MSSSQRKLDAYQAGNIEAAEIIVPDPGRYAGVMQEWAAMVLAKAEEHTAPAAGRAA